MTETSATLYKDLGLWTNERIGWLLYNAAARWKDREFICFEEERYSFLRLERWVTHAAHALGAAGVAPGDRVMLHLGNCMELIVLQLATWRIGAISVPVIPIYRTHEMRSIIAETRPAAIASCFAQGSRNPYLEIDEVLTAQPDYRPRMKILIGGEAAKNTGWFPAPAEPQPGAKPLTGRLPDPAPAEDCCTILFTSGTTSRPKGALLNSRALIANIAVWRHELGLSQRDVAFSGAPLAHIGALFSSFLVPLGLGARTAIISAWNGDRAVAVIAREKATFMAAASVFLSDLVERYERDDAPAHRIKLFGSGGAPTAPDLIKRAESAGIRAFRVYGMTETAGTMTIAPMDADLELRAHYDGYVAYGGKIEIVDEARMPVPFGEVGELRLMSPQLMLAYTDKAATEAQMDAAGWFYPGDVGSITADGWLHISGRIKDIINRGGEKFSALEIEHALEGAPEVRTASVIGYPDERLGEAVAAFLVLVEGVRWQGPEKVLAHLEGMKMARQKFPLHWFTVDALPRSASGKVQKNKLLELALAGSAPDGVVAASV